MRIGRVLAASLLVGAFFVAGMGAERALDASALDALGLSEIELAAALAGEQGLMGFAPGAAELDPVRLLPESLRPTA